MKKRLLVRFGKVVAGLFTILALFHAIETFRGARAWKAERERLEAKGEELNWAKLTQPKTPANDPTGPSRPEVVNWKDPGFLAVPGLRSGFAGLWVPRGADGRIAIENWRNLLLKPSQPTEPETACAAGTSFLEAIRSLDPVIQTLVESARTGPVAAWGIKARQEPRFFPPLEQMHRLSRILQVRIAAHFACGESQRAIDEMRVIARLPQALKGLPFTTAHYWQMTLGNELLDTMEDGLARGQMGEGHRREIATLLNENWIESARMGMRAERNWLIHEAETLELKDFGDYLQWMLIPRGWRLRQAIHISGTADEVLQLIENPGRIDPAAIDGLSHFGGAERTTRYNVVARAWEHNFRLLVKNATALQSRVQLIRTAFALQSFREKTGAFPATLSSLAPDYLAAVPNDIVTGRPLQYRATPQSYILYSVGWDLKDDNARSTPNLAFAERPDWALTVGVH